MLITTYLRDHHMGSAAGVDGFNRVAEEHTDPEVRAALPAIAAEIEEDQEALQKLLEAFDSSPNIVKDTLGKVAEKAARLKPNQRILKRSPLADVLELEALVDAVYAKSKGWQLLMEVDDPRLDRDELQRLYDRAVAQGEELQRLWLKQAPKLLLD